MLDGCMLHTDCTNTPSEQQTNARTTSPLLNRNERTNDRSTESVVSTAVTAGQAVTTETPSVASEQAAVAGPADELLPREPCLAALAALRHAKWFQVGCTSTLFLLHKSNSIAVTAKETTL